MRTCACAWVTNNSYPEQVKKAAGKRKGPATSKPKAAVAETQPVEPVRRSGRSKEDNPAAVDLCGEEDEPASHWGKRGKSKTGPRLSSVTSEPNKLVFDLAVKELRRAVGELCAALPTHDSKAHT